MNSNQSQLEIKDNSHVMVIHNGKLEHLQYKGIEFGRSGEICLEFSTSANELLSFPATTIRAIRVLEILDADE